MRNSLLKFFNPARNCDFFYSELLSAGVILLVVILYRNIGFTSKAKCVGSIILVVGGLANLVERLLTGCVWDYVDFFGLFRFNIFDLMVTFGSGLLIYGIWEKKN